MTPTSPCMRLAAKAAGIRPRIFQKGPCMSHRLSGAAGLAALLFVSAPAWAQYTVELSGNVGYTFSEGVSFPGVSLPNGNIYNSVEPKDAMSWGFSAGVMSYQHYELAFN